MGPEGGERGQLARTGIGLLVRDRNVRVLGDNERGERALLYRRAQPSWTNAVIGDESRDTKLHITLNLPTAERVPMSMTKRGIWLMIRVRRRVSHPARTVGTAARGRRCHVELHLHVSHTGHRDPGLWDCGVGRADGVRPLSD